MTHEEYLELVRAAQVADARATAAARAAYDEALERARVEYNRAVMAAFDAYAKGGEPS